MAPEPLIFDTGSKIFEILEMNSIQQIGKFNCIQSERFTVGGYDWVIEFYPQGINENLSKDIASVAVRVLNPTEEFQATCSFLVWQWNTSRWVMGNTQSGLVNFSSSGSKAHCRWNVDNYSFFSSANWATYVKDEMARIKCVLCVTPRPPAPASPLKPDIYKPAITNNQGNPSGADSSFDNGFHTTDYTPLNGPNYRKLPTQPTFRIYFKANKNLSLTIRNGTVVLAPANSKDYYQHWIKDMTYGDQVKDEWGYPVLALINGVTGEALKNPAGENQEVSLVPYNMNCLDDSVKWAEVRSTCYHVIRIADTTSLNLTAVGNDNDTSFLDGAKIVVKKFVNTPVQNWNIVRYNSNVQY